MNQAYLDSEDSHILNIVRRPNWCSYSIGPSNMTKVVQKAKAAAVPSILCHPSSESQETTGHSGKQGNRSVLGD